MPSSGSGGFVSLKSGVHKSQAGGRPVSVFVSSCAQLEKSLAYEGGDAVGFGRPTGVLGLWLGEDSLCCFSLTDRCISMAYRYPSPYPKRPCDPADDERIWEAVGLVGFDLPLACGIGLSDSASGYARRVAELMKSQMMLARGMECYQARMPPEPWEPDLDTSIRNALGRSFEITDEHRAALCCAFQAHDLYTGEVKRRLERGRPLRSGRSRE